MLYPPELRARLLSRATLAKASGLALGRLLRTGERRAGWNGCAVVHGLDDSQRSVAGSVWLDDASGIFTERAEQPIIPDQTP